MLHWLDIKIEREDQDIAKQKKQMDGDFLYYFEWNAESLYKSHFMSDCYKKLRQALDGVKDTDEIRNILKENVGGAEPYFSVNIQCSDTSELRMFKY